MNPLPLRRSTTRRVAPLATFAPLASVVLALAWPACSSAPARPERDAQQLQEWSAADAAETAAVKERAVNKVLQRLEQGLGADRTIDFLAMSGGGDRGAFGAGLLIGWGTVQDPTWRRPEFEVVTGVSTGALLAPFAFLGTDEACQQVETLYRHPKDDWVSHRSTLSLLGGPESLASIPGLERDVRATIDAAFVERLAAESKRGKVLVVSATDLDLGRQKFWDLGAEAEAAVDEAGRDRLQRMLLASSAIPAAFPPVAVGDGLYTDGGATANVFLRLDPRDPHGVVGRWRAAHPGVPLPPIRYWIVVNNQLAHPAKTVQRRWQEAMSVGVGVSIRSATIAEIRWLTAAADLANACYGTRIEVRVVAIPDDWRAPVAGEFQTQTMQSLADLGRKLGADPASWTLWTAPLGTVAPPSPSPSPSSPSPTSPSSSSPRR